MQFNRNTFSTENLLFDDPPPFLNPSIFIKPFISNLSHTSPSTSLNYVFHHQPSPTKDGLDPHRDGSSTNSSHSLLSLPVLPLIDSDFDFSWLAENVDFSTASTTCVKASSVSTTALASASAFAPASVSAPLLQDGASGFDQLSLLDEACSSGLNTPFTPQMDTPDQTPSQTPMIDCVASDDLASLDLFWTSSPVTVDAPVASTSSVDDASRLQAENALLDFVLFDDIAPTSPISTFSTPMTASITSPSVDLKVSIRNTSLQKANRKTSTRWKANIHLLTLVSFQSNRSLRLMSWLCSWPPPPTWQVRLSLALPRRPLCAAHPMSLAASSLMLASLLLSRTPLPFPPLQFLPSVLPSHLSPRLRTGFRPP
ncbi:MAG: hypothetical protein BYD32DRAFT_269036 [Podila humilis]|nr:MAG: hypothetical protein BYD32DRAFT_269036 [Podila humilis]